MTESRLQRWSRIKRDAARPAEPPAPATVEPEVSAEERELAINESLPEHEVLAKYGLPDPDAIELGTDITGFMRKEIPELLRRRALRKLWTSNPVLAVLDGLNDYDQDFTLAASGGNAVQTLYKVGQGFIEKTRKVAEQIEDQPEEPVATSTVRPPEATTRSPEPEGAAELPQPPQKPEPVIASADTEAEPEPRYRPRMRFD
ncbi:MAG: DUF3306 domain-containing protein [Marinobacter sp.]|uniref:DUF3306 domain-containing protein n=1 Tax=Marinobacter sp. TaxID=50741 RepID=UPI00299E6FD5|nr:DUF3306 domain-containing protein [Marinobacter sp.]MDX1633255.1 DUF3306 domain-containing protein [Marinobacter sp.]